MIVPSFSTLFTTSSLFVETCFHLRCYQRPLLYSILFYQFYYPFIFLYYYLILLFNIYLYSFIFLYIYIFNFILLKTSSLYIFSFKYLVFLLILSMTFFHSFNLILIYNQISDLQHSLYKLDFYNFTQYNI